LAILGGVASNRSAGTAQLSIRRAEALLGGKLPTLLRDAMLY